MRQSHRFGSALIEIIGTFPNLPQIYSLLLYTLPIPRVLDVAIHPPPQSTSEYRLIDTVIRSAAKCYSHHTNSFVRGLHDGSSEDGSVRQPALGRSDPSDHEGVHRDPKPVA